MIEITFAGFQLDRDRLELSFLFFGQDRLDSVHVISEPCHRQEIPAMTAWNIMDATVFPRRIVEANPARQMRHRLRPLPVRIVLMPGDHPAMMWRLYEKLIVPKPHRATEQLRCRHQERGIPKQVMKRRRNAPRTKSMKKHRCRIRRFIRVKFVEEIVTWMIRIN